jgi:UDP-N-acetylmuramyl pentapeptide synthase
MADFNLTEVLKATGGQLINAGSSKLFQGVSTDTRNIAAGNLFVALVGERFDGNEFAAQAAAKGATVDCQ